MYPYGPQRRFIPVKLNGIVVELQHDSPSDITTISKDMWIHTTDGAIYGNLAEFQKEISIRDVTKAGRIFNVEFRIAVNSTF